ncbi:MAG: 30S ribosomal protein S1 [Bacteroidetes bacterium]|nr:30S ribosomal protein S1 [Bacteroidota bacterium]MCW5896132.1 30S ribosomal protein S1 [Bacteroidota bacterium]
MADSNNSVVDNVVDREYGEAEYNDLKRLYESSMGKISEGEIVKGRVVAIHDNEVSVDIGFKSEGTVPLAEFTNKDELRVGDEIEVFLESVENKDGQLVLSRKRADFMRVWERVTKAFETGEVLQGRCVRRIKGGIVVDLLGIDAFLPGSQIDVRPVRDFDAFIGKTLDFRVVKINHPSENVVVSHKVLVEEEMSGQRQAIISSLEKGQILEGTVKAITDFGVFVDLGGVDGLVHITDLSWGRINHPSEIVKLDQKINVVVLDFDQEKKRISLGYKQLQPHPWENIETKYPVGTKVIGKVVSLADYGAFVEIEKGIEGLIHISEMSWTQHIKHPSQVVSMGQMVDAVILSLDKDNKKLSLGIKQLEPDPWLNLMQKYPVDSRHKGIVRNLTNFGVFVELEQGVDGLVHISDLSWTKKIRHPGEVVKKGDEIEVVILSVDVDQRRISLGHKQIEDNPWDRFGDTYKVGTEVEGKIVRIIEKGVIVELPMGVDGFVPVSQLAQSQVKNIADKFKVGEALPLKVLEFEKESKKIVLSAVEALKDKETHLVDEYMAQHKLPSSTIGDAVGAQDTQALEGDTSIPAEN